MQHTQIDRWDLILFLTSSSIQTHNLIGSPISLNCPSATNNRKSATVSTQWSVKIWKENANKQLLIKPVRFQQSIYFQLFCSCAFTFSGFSKSDLPSTAALPCNNCCTVVDSWYLNSILEPSLWWNNKWEGLNGTNEEFADDIVKVVRKN